MANTLERAILDYYLNDSSMVKWAWGQYEDTGEDVDTVLNATRDMMSDDFEEMSPFTGLEQCVYDAVQRLVNVERIAENFLYRIGVINSLEEYPDPL